MADKLEKALASCLERVEHGESLESCLARYPEMASDLGPLLRTAILVRQTSRATPRQEFRAAGRRRLMVSARAAPARARPWWRVNLNVLGWRWAAVTASLLVVLLGWGTVAMASNSLPDETLYPVKIATEEVKLALTPGVVRKARLEMDLIEQRTREIADLVELDRTAEVERASQRLDSHLARLAAIAAAAEQGPATQAELEALVEGRAAGPKAALEKALARAPDAAKPSVKKALERTEAGYQVAQQRINPAKASQQAAGGKRPAGATPPPAKAPVTPGPAPRATPGALATPTPATTPVPGLATPAPGAAATPPSRPVVTPSIAPPPKAPTAAPRAPATPKPAPPPPPKPRPKGFLKSDDGLASVECVRCSVEEEQRYLDKAHSQALTESTPFNAIVAEAYAYVDNKLVKQAGKKLFRIMDARDGSMRIEWECGPCDAGTLGSLRRRIEDAYQSLAARMAMSVKPNLFISVSSDGRSFNVTSFTDKLQLNGKRPSLAAAYPWHVGDQRELLHDMFIALNGIVRYTREDFVAESLAIWNSESIGNEQYISRMQQLRAGKAYSPGDPVSFDKVTLGTDILIALRYEGFGHPMVEGLVRQIEGKNVNWKQFKEAAKAVAEREVVTLNHVDRGIALWRSQKAARK